MSRFAGFSVNLQHDRTYDTDSDRSVRRASHEGLISRRRTTYVQVTAQLMSRQPVDPVNDDLQGWRVENIPNATAARKSRCARETIEYASNADCVIRSSPGAARDWAFA